MSKRGAKGMKAFRIGLAIPPAVILLCWVNSLLEGVDGITIIEWLLSTISILSFSYVLSATLWHLIRKGE